MSAFVFTLQCSVSCGYGIQSRAVSCMGPSKPEPISPLFCMHIPKPITIQGCYIGSCEVPSTSGVSSGTTTVKKVNLTDTTLHHIGQLSPGPTEAVTIPQTITTTNPKPKPSQYRQKPVRPQQQQKQDLVLTMQVLFQIYVDSYSWRNQVAWILKKSPTAARYP